MIKQNENPTKDYKNFGMIVGAILVLVFGITIPFIKTGTINYYFIGPGVILFFLSFTLPILLKYPYKIWMKIGEVLGWINTRILLGVVFFIVLFPIGVLLLLFGKKPIKNNKNKVDSFKQKSVERNWNHYEKPF